MKILLTFITLITFVSQINLSGQNLLAELGDQVDIVVAQDGSGNFTTITEAINSVTKNSSQRTVIFVKNGTYFEKLEIASDYKKITLIGEDVDSTILEYDDYSGSGESYNGIMTSRIGDPIGTSTSHTMYIDADEFILMNMTVKNSAGDVGQAVATNLGGDRTILVHCRILGNQDTFYTWGYGRFYMYDCFLEGAVDFIFGRGVAVFDSCIINTVRNGAPVTAASTDENWKFGYVFQNCKITANRGVTGVPLGRPWKAYAQTVFMNSFLDNHIISGGWSVWSTDPNHSGYNNYKTCYYAEYQNYGPASGTASRVDWSHQLTEVEAANYTIANMFAKDVNPSNFSSNWTPDLHNDPVYQILKSQTFLLYNDSLQNNADLASIAVNGENIADFTTTNKSYSIDLSDTTTQMPVITAVSVSPKATIKIEYPDELPGRAKIIVTAVNGFSLTYTIRFSLVAGIKQQNDLTEFISNPFNDQLKIKLKTLLNHDPVIITLIDVNGKTILSETLQIDNTASEYYISTASLNTGIYVCRIVNGSATYQQKVIKQ